MLPPGGDGCDTVNVDTLCSLSIVPMEVEMTLLMGSIEVKPDSSVVCADRGGLVPLRGIDTVVSLSELGGSIVDCEPVMHALDIFILHNKSCEIHPHVHVLAYNGGHCACCRGDYYYWTVGC